MRTAVVETQEDNTGHIGWEIVDGVPLGGTATADSMAPSPSPVEVRPKKKRPAQHIGCGTITIKTVSQLAYQARGCSGGSHQ